MRALLEQLCQVNAPTGFEGPAVEVAKNLLTPLVDEVYTDRIGSVVGVKPLRQGERPAGAAGRPSGRGRGSSSLGHDEGFLRFAPLGGSRPQDAARPRADHSNRPTPHRRGGLPCRPTCWQQGSGNKAIPIADLRGGRGSVPGEGSAGRSPWAPRWSSARAVTALGDDRLYRQVHGRPDLLCHPAGDAEPAAERASWTWMCTSSAPCQEEVQQRRGHHRGLRHRAGLVR